MACSWRFSDRILMTSYSVIIHLQRRHPSIYLMVSIMIPMSNPIAEPSRVLPSRVLQSQNREFALLTETILCFSPVHYRRSPFLRHRLCHLSSRRPAMGPCFPTHTYQVPRSQYVPFRSPAPGRFREVGPLSDRRHRSNIWPCSAASQFLIKK